MQGVKKKINDDFINIMKTNLMVWKHPSRYLYIYIYIRLYLFNEVYNYGRENVPRGEKEKDGTGSPHENCFSRISLLILNQLA